MINGFDFLMDIGVLSRYFRLVVYIIKHTNTDRIFYCTFDKVSVATEISQPRISAFFRDLVKKGYLVMVQRGVYQVDADFYNSVSALIERGDDGDDVRSDYEKMKDDYNALRQKVA